MNDIPTRRREEDVLLLYLVDGCRDVCVCVAGQPVRGAKEAALCLKNYGVMDGFDGRDEVIERIRGLGIETVSAMTADNIRNEYEGNVMVLFADLGPGGGVTNVHAQSEPYGVEIHKRV